MASDFELALEGGIREIVDSALGQSLTVIQPGATFEVRAVWREGESVAQRYQGVYATVLCVVADFEGTDGRVQPAVGQHIERLGKRFEVRAITLNGVGGVTMFVRFLRDTE